MQFLYNTYQYASPFKTLCCLPPNIYREQARMAQVKKASSTSAWAVPVCVPAAPADVFCAAATMLAHIDVPRAPESGCRVLITALPEAESSADRQRIAQSVTVGIEAACPKEKMCTARQIKCC